MVHADLAHYKHEVGIKGITDQHMRSYSSHLLRTTNTKKKTYKAITLLYTMLYTAVLFML